MSADYIDGRLNKIETDLATILKLLSQQINGSTPNSISRLAELISSGDRTALRNQNKSRAAQRRPHAS